MKKLTPNIKIPSSIENPVSNDPDDMYVIKGKGNNFIIRGYDTLSM